MYEMHEPLPLSLDNEMEGILQEMLDADEDITARSVIRRHPKLKAASSITRNEERSKLLAHYQEKQTELRSWQKRITKKSKDTITKDIVKKDARIANLEHQVKLLTASHVAMIKAVGELGGFSKWAKFFENFKSVRDQLDTLGAMADADINIVDLKATSDK